MRQAIKAEKAGDWADLVKGDKLNAWTSAKLRVCFCEVEQEEEERNSMVQHISQKSTDFLRRIIVPVEGQGGVTLSYVCPHCHRYPLEEAVQLVVRCVWRPVRLGEPEWRLGHTG